VRFTLARPTAVCEIRLYDEPEVVHQAIAARPTAPQVEIKKPDLPGVFLDDTEADAVGYWSESTHKAPFFCRGYSTDENREKGARALVFHPKATGRFEIRLAYVAYANRASNVPITVSHVEGKTKSIVDQRLEPPLDGRFVSLGTHRLDAASTIRVDTTGTDGYVIVDGLQLLPVE